MDENEAAVIKEFVAEMMAEKGLSDAALAAQLEEKLGEQIEQATLRALPDGKLDELEKLLDGGGSDEEIEKLFEEAGADYAAAAEAAMAAFREAFLKSGSEEKADAGVSAETNVADGAADVSEVSEEKADVSEGAADAE